MSKIISVSNFTKVFTNLKRGDCLFFDIDETLLFSGLDRYQDTPELTENELAAQITTAQEMGVRVYGLTARHDKFADKTIQHLEQLGITFAEVIHAPSITNDQGEQQLQKAKTLKKYIDALCASDSDTKPKRVIVIDDLKQQLDDIETAFSANDPSLILNHYDRLEYQPITKQIPFPPNLRDFSKVAALGGGTESTFKIHNEQTNKSLVLKYGAHPDALKAEILCNALYRTLGVPVPNSQIYNTIPDALAKNLNLKRAHGIFQVCEYISEPDSTITEEMRIEQARKHFVAHALLGNIDVAKHDNFIGETLIDAGANFLYRAKGEKRTEEASIVSEINSLVNPEVNPEAARWFSPLTKAEIKAQVIAILEKQDAIEKILWDVSAELKFTPEVRTEFLQHFVERLDYLVTHFCPEARQSAHIDRKAHAENTAAGVLTWTSIDGVPHILFAKRVRHDWWDNFGGKSEPEDTCLYETASREVAEESNNQLNYTHDELLNSPFHDLISEKNGKPYVYRMYITAHDYIPPTQFQDKEHTDYQWVPIQTIVDALASNEPMTVEDQETIAVHEKDK